MNKDMREAASQIDDGEVAKVEAIVSSMTPAERNDTTMMDGSRRSRVARGSGTTVQDVNSLLKQFKEMQKMMKGMASGNMPNLPGMPNMSGMSGRAAKKLAKEAGGFGGAGQGAGGAGGGPGGADFDMLSQLMGDGSGAELAELTKGFPGLADGAAPRPVVSVNKGTKKKKKGGRVTPPKNR
jgi:Signal peptide binding domain